MDEGVDEGAGVGLFVDAAGVARDVAGGEEFDVGGRVVDGGPGFEALVVDLFGVGP